MSHTAVPQLNRGSVESAQIAVDSSTGKRFRKSAQGFVVNEFGLFLAGTPVGNGNEKFLQTVQGGMEPGEDELQTLSREFQEEVGLSVGVHLSFVAELVPRMRGGDTSDDHREDDKDASRSAFRYLSKTWRKSGIAGQQLCPSLFFAESSVITECQLQPRDKNIRREFKSVAWVPLSRLSQCAPPVKRQVMEAIVPHVYDAALAYLSQYYPAACGQLQRQSALVRREASKDPPTPSHSADTAQRRHTQRHAGRKRTGDRQ